MNIKVVREDGALETVDFSAGIALAKGGDGVNAIEDCTGRVHFFTPAGLYQGFGQFVEGNIPLNAAADLLRRMEAQRTIEGASPIVAPTPIVHPA